MPRLPRGELTITVDAPPSAVYAVVSDITRTPEWSPECVACEWTGTAQEPKQGATFRGTNKRDVIVAGKGSDVVLGRRGNDVICLGAGNDRASGGAGRDRILGGAGRDRLVGGAGRDVLRGGRGRDLQRQ